MRQGAFLTVSSIKLFRSTSVSSNSISPVCESTSSITPVDIVSSGIPVKFGSSIIMVLALLNRKIVPTFERYLIPKWEFT